MNIRTLIILFFLGCALPTQLEAGDTIKSIALMLDRLPVVPQASDSVWKCPKYDHGFGIRVRRNQNGDINLLGIRFFPNRAKENNDPIICECIERLLLQLSIEETSPISGIKSWIKQMNVNITVNGLPYGNGAFANLNPAFEILRNPSNVQIEEKYKEYIFSVTDEKDITFALTFPKERSFIFGTDKHEGDQYIATLIRNATNNSLPQTDLLQSSSFSATKYQGIVQHKGEPYMIDRLRATTYFKQSTKDSLSIISGPEYPDLALTNILLLATGSANMKVMLTHKVYGANPIFIEKRWGDIMSILVTKGSRLYAAAREKEDEPEKLAGVLVIHNPHYDYIDMLVVTVEKIELFKNDTPTIEARLYTNVPQGNILNLFN